MAKQRVGGILGSVREDGEVSIEAPNLWDTKEKRLRLARDPIGKEGMYIATRPGFFAFASEVRALVRAGFVQKNPSRRAIASYLARGAVAEPDTIFEGASPLPPGAALEFSFASRGGRTRQTPVFSGLLGADKHKDAATARSALRRAIQACLPAEGPAAVLLSGGRASSLVATIAAEASPEKLRTFTLSFDEAANSEAHDAADLARALGADHHEARLSGDLAASWLLDAVRAMDQPSVGAFGMYLLARTASDAGFSSALSGLGGHAMLAQGPTLQRFSALLAAGRAARAASPLLDRALRVASRFGPLPALARDAEIAARAAGSLEKTYAAVRTLFSPEEIAALVPPDVRDEAAILPLTMPESLEPLFAAGALSAADVFSCLEISNHLRDGALRDLDVFSRSFGLRVDAPLLDASFVTSVAPGALGADKPAHAEPFLPLRSWLAGPMRSLARELLLGEAARGLPFLDAAAAGRVYRDFAARPSNERASRVFALLILIAYFQGVGGND